MSEMKSDLLLANQVLAWTTERSNAGCTSDDMVVVDSDDILHLSLFLSHTLSWPSPRTNLPPTRRKNSPHKIAPWIIQAPQPLHQGKVVVHVEVLGLFKLCIYKSHMMTRYPITLAFGEFVHVMYV